MRARASQAVSWMGRALPLHSPWSHHLVYQGLAQLKEAHACPVRAPGEICMSYSGHSGLARGALHNIDNSITVNS